MSQNRLVLPGILVVASAGLVLAMYLLLGGSGKSAQQQAAKTPVAQARDGVQAMELDSARRGSVDEDPASAPPTEPAVEVPLSDAELAVLAERQRPQPPPEPVPQVPLTAEEKATEKEFAALRATVTKDVQRQLGQQASALKQACWKPELTGGASSASYSVSATFDPAGQLLGVGVSDSRDGGVVPGVGQCLRQQALALEVAPPGHAITVDVPLRLP